ncbi:hypothetical protein RN001_016332 [Aquatica leii]|uniref:Deoxynucleoside kinase domain-containing protein n=1 Tax=Aquatica leii TaxID=1421715 RepID=A0AAN7QBE9_9COLE|nr:hypothetical protein RN001_016332 [Aquatica leii]
MSKRAKYEMKPFTVLVEGNIGSGKTTFLNYFKKYENVCVMAEPIDMWRNCGGHNLLEYMYEDRERWGFTFQSYVQLTMLKQHTLKTRLPIKLMERSIYSARYCFVEKMHRDGILPSPSASVINEWFKWTIANVDTSVDLIIYLRTTPDVVYQRMQERNRKEEKTVSLTYLTEMHEMHENWLYHKTMFTCPAPVLVLNADLDKSVIAEEYERVEPHIFSNCLSVLAS